MASRSKQFWECVRKFSDFGSYNRSLERWRHARKIWPCSCRRKGSRNYFKDRSFYCMAHYWIWNSPELAVTDKLRDLLCTGSFCLWKTVSVTANFDHFWHPVVLFYFWYRIKRPSKLEISDLLHEKITENEFDGSFYSCYNYCNDNSLLYHVGILSWKENDFRRSYWYGVQTKKGNNWKTPDVFNPYPWIFGTITECVFWKKIQNHRWWRHSWDLENKNYTYR